MVTCRQWRSIFRMCEGEGRGGVEGLGDGSWIVGSSGIQEQSWGFFVNECLNFDVLGQKRIKTAKIPPSTITAAERVGGGQTQGPLNTPLLAGHG